MELQDVLIKPLTTEKTTTARDQNVYAFLVARDANKILIKNAVEKLFDVKVENVTVSIRKPKKKTQRYGRVTGYSNFQKKAWVKVKKDQKIGELEI